MDTDKWLKEIDHVTQSFKKEFGNLSDEQLNWKPASDSWSIAQIIDHLITINSSYFHTIKNVHTRKLPWFARFNFITNFFWKGSFKSSKSCRKKKTKTFSIWEPSKSHLSKDIIERFEKHQDELKRIISNSEDLLKKQLIISSPANRNIVYKLSAAFDIIVAHEKRHLNQAQSVLEMLPK